MGMEDWYAAGRRARISGLEVFYRRSGNGETLVCLHGFANSSWDFEPVWPSLTRRFDAVAHDLIGLGRSEKPERPLPVDLQKAVVAMRLMDGVLDPVCGRKIAERYTALVPGADIVFMDDVGHYPHLEAPEAVLEHFHDFHDRLSEER